MLVRILTFTALFAAPTAGDVSITPPALEFGPWRVSDTVADTVQVSVVGAGFTISRLSIVGDGFALSPSPMTGDDLVALPGTSVRIPIAFTPADVKAFAAVLDLEIDGVVQSVSLTGEGVESGVVVNEILADPPSGNAGDANGDGTRHSTQDEFVELLNITRWAIPIGGHTLSDRGAKRQSRFAFPEETILAPGERVVLFGGGAPEGFHGRVFVDDGRIGGGLTNTGDAVYLVSPEDDTLCAVEYGREASADQSIVRHPDGHGPFVRHRSPPSLERFSPGRPREALQSLSVPGPGIDATLGRAFLPDVRGITSAGDTVDLLEPAAWSTSTPDALSWKDGAWLPVAPGPATITAAYDTVQSPPVSVDIRMPESFTLSLTPGDSVILTDTSIAMRAMASAPGLSADVSILADWDIPANLTFRDDGALIAVSPGPAAVRASLSGQSAEASLRVGLPGDFDLDGRLTTADAVRLIHIALQIPPPPEPFERSGADANDDGLVDVFDLVALVDRILGRGTTKPTIARPIVWHQRGDSVFVSAGPTRGLVVETATEARLTALDGSVTGHGTFWLVRYDAASRDLVLLSTSSVERVFAVGPGGGEAPAIEGRLSAFPNPFNARTTLSFAVGSETTVRLSVYNLLGQEVVTLAHDRYPAGDHRVVWDGRDRSRSPVGSGVYIGKLDADTRSDLVRLLLVQ